MTEIELHHVKLNAKAEYKLAPRVLHCLRIDHLRPLSFYPALLGSDLLKLHSFKRDEKTTNK